MLTEKDLTLKKAADIALAFEIANEENKIISNNLQVESSVAGNVDVTLAIKCFKCGNQGHIARNCERISSLSVNRNNMKCFKCNKVGHLASRCWRKDWNRTKEQSTNLCLPTFIPGIGQMKYMYESHVYYRSYFWFS